MTGTQFVATSPPPHLRPLIADITGYHVRSAPGVHHGLPSRSLTVVIALDDIVDLRPASGPAQSLTALVGGLHAKPVEIAHNGLQHGIQLGLTPLGARALFRLPAGELAEDVVDLSDLLGPAATELAEQLREATTWSERFARLNDTFTRLATPARTPSPELDWIWRRMTETDGLVPVASLADGVGWSRQHLGARFRREFGLPPKLLGRIMRFERARRRLITGGGTLAGIAADCGYSDQAHFNRDWREFSGLTPSRWMAEEFPIIQDTGSLSGAS